MGYCNWTPKSRLVCRRMEQSSGHSTVEHVASCSYTPSTVSQVSRVWDTGGDKLRNTLTNRPACFWLEPNAIWTGSDRFLQRRRSYFFWRLEVIYMSRRVPRRAKMSNRYVSIEIISCSKGSETWFLKSIGRLRHFEIWSTLAQNKIPETEDTWHLNGQPRVLAWRDFLRAPKNCPWRKILAADWY